MRDRYKRTASVRKNANGFGLLTSNFCEASFKACKTSAYGSIGFVGFSFFVFPRRFRFSKNHKPTADKTLKSAMIHGNRETFNFAGGRKSRMSPRSCGSSSSVVGGLLFVPEGVALREMFAKTGDVCDEPATSAVGAVPVAEAVAPVMGFAGTVAPVAVEVVADEVVATVAFETVAEPVDAGTPFEVPVGAVCEGTFDD